MTAIRKHAKRNEMLICQQRKLTALLIAFMGKIGAKQTGLYEFEDKRYGVDKTYEYELETPLGLLTICFAEPGHHLHCRFRDLARANAVLNPSGSLDGPVNRYSGKYNVYVFHRCSAQEAFETIFEPHLSLIWRRCNLPVPWGCQSGRTAPTMASTGSGIGNLTCGDRIGNVKQVQVGDLLAEYCPQFDSTNLISVTRIAEDASRFYARHVDPQNPAHARRHSMGEFCVWGFQIGDMHRLHCAVMPTRESTQLPSPCL